MLLNPYRFGRAGTVFLPDPMIYSSNLAGAAATASLALGSNGQATGYGGGATSFAWLTGGNASDFEVVVDPPSSGAFTGSPTVAGTYNLGLTRTWAVTRSTIGSNSVTALFKIKRVGDPTILASGTLTLTASMTAAEGGGGSGDWGGGGRGDVNVN